MEAVAAGPMAGFVSHVISLQTGRAREFIDITDQVESLLARSKMRNGLMIVASQHTTAGLVVNEHEPELLKDLERLLGELAPEGGEYAHNLVPCGPDERENGHAHCQALLLTGSASIPIVDGRLLLGRYQRIFLVELDCARPRRVTVTILGT